MAQSNLTQLLTNCSSAERPGEEVLIPFSASHAARCVACHGVRSRPVPVALGSLTDRDLPVERAIPEDG
jgi:hypothetical protein